MTTKVPGVSTWGSVSISRFGGINTKNPVKHESRFNFSWPASRLALRAISQRWPSGVDDAPSRHKFVCRWLDEYWSTKANAMRRMVISIVGSMLISLCVVQAQQTERDGTAKRDRERQQDRQSEQDQRERKRAYRDRWQQQSDRAKDEAHANEGMVIIKKDEIPSSLRQKLEHEKYEGWENGTIYHNTNTGEYVIAPRAFRFDKNGNEIEMTDETPDYRTEKDEIGAGTQTEPGRSGREQYSTEDMIEVQAEQIPASLRRTLNERKYNGWEENGTLYQDPSTSDYVLVMDKDGNAIAPRMYRFDRNGRLQRDDGRQKE